MILRHRADTQILTIRATTSADAEGATEHDNTEHQGLAVAIAS